MTAVVGVNVFVDSVAVFEAIRELVGDMRVDDGLVFEAGISITTVAGMAVFEIEQASADNAKKITRQGFRLVLPRVMVWQSLFPGCG
jgi:hypothetical protein